jgi:hypothetical protein
MTHDIGVYADEAANPRFRADGRRCALASCTRVNIIEKRLLVSTFGCAEDLPFFGAARACKEGFKNKIKYQRKNKQ